MKCLWYFIYVVSFHFTPKCLCYTLSLTGPGNDRRGAESNRIEVEEREWDYTRQSDRDTKYNSNSKSEDSRFKGWNYVDTSEEWKPHAHKKTIDLQVVDDPYYHGQRPVWPNDEYMYGYYGSYNRNGSGSNSSKPDANKMDYEWQNLPHRYGSYYGYPGYHTHHHHTAAATDVTKLDTPDAQGTNTDKRHLGYGYNNGFGYNRYPYGSTYGGDLFRGLGTGRKRVRLQIHPGLIAAPIAGFAAYKAASALNPLLVELGILDKGHGWGYGGGGGYGGGSYGGGGYPPPYYPPPAPVLPPSYPPVSYPHIPYNPPVVPPIYGDGHTPYPILIPKRQEQEKSSWWNPFSALTPRDED